MSKLLANQIANFGDDAPIEIKEGLNIPAGKPLQAAGVVGNSGQVLTSTGATIQWVTPFDGNYNSLTGTPTIPSAQVQVDWNASGGISSILNKPTVPPLSSVVTNVAGSASLTFNSGNGQFTYTPPDLSGYAANTNVSNWDAAYGWGDHGTEGYLVASNTDKSNWNAAYGWGDHNSAGYLTSYTETSTFQNVIDRGNTCTSPVYVTNKLYFSNVFSTLTDLQAVNAATYHGMFAHAHDTGHGYFAHSNAWKQLIDEASSIDELGDVDTTTVSPSDGYVLKWETSSSSWKPAPDLVGTSNAGITLQDLSVNNVAASATPSLSYSNTTGVFTYTPYDPSTFTETDPVFSASAVSAVQSTDIANWDSSYGWGNHASAGYLTAESDTLATVTGRGASTSTNITLSGDCSFAGGNVTMTASGTPNSLNVSGTSRFEVASMENALLDGSIDHTGDTTTKIQFETSVIKLDTAGTTRINVNNSGATVTGTLAATAVTGDGSGLTALTGAAAGTYGSANTTPVITVNADGRITDVTETTISGGGGGGGGASVTVSDTPPGSASSGDLWWESDTGRLKIYYQDTDSTQWVDTSPPLADATTIGASGTVSMKANIIPDSNEAYDLGSAEYKIRHLFLSDNSMWLGNSTKMSVGFRNNNDAQIGARPTVRFYNRNVNQTPKPVADAGGSVGGCITYVTTTFPGRSGPINASTLLLTDWTGYWSSLTGAPIGTYGVDDLYPPQFLNGDINPAYFGSDWADAMGFSQNGQERAITIASDNAPYDLAESDTFIRVNATDNFNVNIDSISTDTDTFFNMTIWISQGGSAWGPNTFGFSNGAGGYTGAVSVKYQNAAANSTVQAIKITGIKISGSWHVNVDYN